MGGESAAVRIPCLVSSGLASLKPNFSCMFWCLYLLCNSVSPSHGNNVFCILQAVRQEIVSYVQLIVEREKKKFNATLKKINKQLGKEKKLLSMDKTKGLIKEHEVWGTLLFCLSLNALLSFFLLCYVSTEQRGHQNCFFTFFDCR